MEAEVVSRSESHGVTITHASCGVAHFSARLVVSHRTESACFAANENNVQRGTMRAFSEAAKQIPSTSLERSRIMFTTFVRAVVVGLFVSSLVVADDKTSAGPVCCAKRAYCCSIKASCCGKTVEAEVIPLAYDPAEAAKPICCDKRAYCCTVKAPCCGKTLVVEIVDVTKDVAATGSDALPICCSKRAYCCTMKATCCGKETKVDLVAKADVKVEEPVAAVGKDALPICCAKRAYCCTIKSPCCKKEIAIELVR